MYIYIIIIPKIVHLGVLGWKFAKPLISKKLSLFQNSMMNSLHSTEWNVCFFNCTGNKNLEKTWHPWLIIPISTYMKKLIDYSTQWVHQRFDRMSYNLYFVWFLFTDGFKHIVDKWKSIVIINKNAYKKHLFVKSY